MSVNIITLATSSSLSLSFQLLLHPDPLQLPQAIEHFTLCFLYVHLIYTAIVRLTVTSDYAIMPIWSLIIYFFFQTQRKIQKAQRVEH